MAKVERDALMCEYARQYPEYDFASNKGYASAAHIQAIKKHGLDVYKRQAAGFRHVLRRLSAADGPEGRELQGRPQAAGLSLIHIYHLIDLWGADHHGYIRRCEAMLAAWGYPGALEVVLGDVYKRQGMVRENYASAQVNYREPKRK